MNGGTGVVTSARVSHDRVPVETVERARFDDPGTAVSALLADPAVEEAFVLQTCHRVEAYVVTPAEEAGRAALADAGPDGADAVVVDHEASLRHLLRVAAGLESLVLGEDQILGQVRDAYEAARAAGGVGPVLEDAVTKAIHVGERARTETAINEGVVSMGGAAVRLAESARDLDGCTALVVGAGEMGTLTAKAFAARDVERVVVANRTPERAAEVAETLPAPATATGLGDLADRLAEAAVAVTATGSDDPVIDADALADAGETVVVDLAQPRDLAPEAAAVDAVTAYDVDDLEAVTDATEDRRREAAGAVEAMVDREFDRLLDQQKRRRADEVIATMYESAERVKHRELSTACSRLEAAGDLDDDQREVVESLADALVSRLLAAPTKSLRQAAAEDDWRTIHTALELFDPEFDGDAPFDPDDAGESAPEAVPDDAPFDDALDEAAAPGPETPASASSAPSEAERPDGGPGSERPDGALAESEDD